MTANFSDSDPQDAVDFDDAIQVAKVLVAHFNRVEVGELYGLGDHDGLHIIAQAVLGMKKELDDLASRLETAQSEEMSMAAEVDTATAELEDAEAQVTALRTALVGVNKLDISLRAQKEIEAALSAVPDNHQGGRVILAAEDRQDAVDPLRVADRVIAQYDTGYGDDLCLDAAIATVTALRTALDIAANRFESAVRAVGTPEGPFQRWADEIRTVLSAHDQAQEK